MGEYLKKHKVLYISALILSILFILLTAWYRLKGKEDALLLIKNTSKPILEEQTGTPVCTETIINTANAVTSVPENTPIIKDTETPIPTVRTLAPSPTIAPATEISTPKATIAPTAHITSAPSPTNTPMISYRLNIDECMKQLADYTGSLLYKNKDFNGILDRGEEELRGVWIATVGNIDFPSKPGLTNAQLMAEIDVILKNTYESGLNTVFFQVRPCADSMYRSESMPWSEYLTGTQGKSPESDFDPLSYMIDKAKVYGIEIHAWMNPYRITYSGTSTSKLSTSNLALKHPEWVMTYNKALYFNPAIPEVRDMITDEISYLIRNYDIAGIHFDDYFYPYRASYPDGTDIEYDDMDEYIASGSKLEINDWRRENVNKLIEQCSNVIRNDRTTYRKEVLFGCAPFGIWANSSSIPEGSDTAGNSSYYANCADTKKWVENGWLDYICPLVYWSINTSYSPYDEIVSWWDNVTSNTSCSLYIGMAAYRVTENIPLDWTEPTQILRQLILARECDNYCGFSLYGYSSVVKDKNGFMKILKDFFNGVIPDIDNYMYPNSLVIASPSDGYVTSEEKIYILGSSDPNYSLTMNGIDIERTKSGLFCVYVQLPDKTNSFVFKHKGVTTTIKINKPSDTPPVTTETVLPHVAVYALGPGKDMTCNPGDTVTLTCRAPSGSVVNVILGSDIIKLKQTTKLSTSGKLAQAYFSGSYVIPQAADNNAPITSLGKPVFYAIHEGVKVNRTSDYEIFVVKISDKLVGRTVNDANVYATYKGELSVAFVPAKKGQTAYITELRNNYYHLNSGGWIHASNVVLSYETLPETIIEPIDITSDNDHTYISFRTNIAVPVNYIFGSDKLVIKFYTESNISLKPVSYIQNSVFSSIIAQTYSTSDKSVSYELALRSNDSLRGIDHFYTEDGVTFKLKSKKTIDNSDKPLSGITIVLDPGHGGSDVGSYGPYYTYRDSEAAICLDIALRLEKLLTLRGATVVLTRRTNATVPYDRRTSIAESCSPDLLISIHLNYVGKTSLYAITGKGASLCYFNELGKNAAKIIGEQYIELSGMYDRGISYLANAVIASCEYPSVFIQCGFITNINDYEMLFTDQGKNNAAIALLEGIFTYFD